MVFINKHGFQIYLLSSFSHLDRNLNWLHFAVKKLRTTFIYGSAKKAGEKKSEEDEQLLLAELRSAHCHS